MRFLWLGFALCLWLGASTPSVQAQTSGQFLKQGLAAYQAEQFLKVERLFSEALRFNPLPATYALRGDARARLGDQQSALVDLNRSKAIAVIRSCKSKSSSSSIPTTRR